MSVHICPKCGEVGAPGNVPCDGKGPGALKATTGSADDIVLQLKLPVPVTELAAVADALSKIHGKNTLFMRQVGPMLQLYIPRAERNENIEIRQGGENQTPTWPKMDAVLGAKPHGTDRTDATDEKEKS